MRSRPGALPAHRRIELNVVFFNIYCQLQRAITPQHAFNSYATIEARISEACDALNDVWYTNCTQAASAYDVPIRRLQRRWDGSASKSTRVSTNKALTEAQEGAICEYINGLDKINMCARPQMIVGAANYLVCFENRVVGHQWFKTIPRAKCRVSDQRTPQRPASVLKHGQKLQRAYAKLKPGEKVDSERIQRFIRGSIASAHTLGLAARDLKAIQEARTNRSGKTG